MTSKKPKSLVASTVPIVPTLPIGQISDQHKKKIEKSYISLQGFKTKNSSDINYKLLIHAKNVIDRQSARDILTKLCKYEFISYEIEKGLFEFSLIQVTTNKLQDHFVLNIYIDQLANLCCNLNPSDEKIGNKTLLPNILNNNFNPYFVAFLPPDQLHPERWIEIIQKKELQESVVNNIQTTDMYKCKKCHERKFKITEIQLRSSDEPINRVCVCMTCLYTFIL